MSKTGSCWRKACKDPNDVKENVEEMSKLGAETMHASAPTRADKGGGLRRQTRISGVPCV